MLTLRDDKLPPALLFDIEGTTTSISFVKEELFPYARKEMEPYLRLNWRDSEMQDIVELVRQQSREDAEKGLINRPLARPEEENDEERMIKCTVDYLLWQMDQDRKTTGLKALQGKIWRRGYEDGIIKSHTFCDVAPAFLRWTEIGKKIYIYSSGSIEAQVLLFKHSNDGDLTQFISGNFDTTTGPKNEAQSYVHIAEKIGIPPQDILFFTDISKEAYAAKEAGMSTLLVIRPGNALPTSNDLNELQTIKSFNEFTFIV